MKNLIVLVCSFFLLVCSSCINNPVSHLVGDWIQVKGQGQGTLIKICKEPQGESTVGMYKGKCVWSGFKYLSEEKNQFLVYRRFRSLEGPKKRLSGIKLEPCLLQLIENRLQLRSLETDRILEVYQRCEKGNKEVLSLK